MNEAEVLQVLEDRGALLNGHFRLSSGRHSDVFVQKFRVLEHPTLAQRFGDAIADLFDRRFDVVASPAVGAVILGFATALAAHARMIFAERVAGVLEFRRGFHIESRERVLVVEDVVTTGGSARAVVDLVRAAGGDAIGVGALLDRSDRAQPLDFGVPFRALIRLDVNAWLPEDCPLCARDVAIDDPGSRRLNA